MRLARGVELAVASAMALSVMAVPSKAEDYYRSGYWVNSIITANDGETPLCLMRTYFPESGKLVFIKYNQRNDTFFIQLAKTGWNIPEGQPVPVEVGFDKNGWGAVDSGYGYAYKAKDGKTSSGIFINFKREAVDDFLEEFSKADLMWFRFGGNEKPWVVKMDGSRNSAASFKACANKLASSRPTQPFSSSKPRQEGTQPYSTQKEQVQPEQKEENFELPPPTQKPAVTGRDRSA